MFILLDTFAGRPQGRRPSATDRQAPGPAGPERRWPPIVGLSFLLATSAVFWRLVALTVERV